MNALANCEVRYATFEELGITTSFPANEWLSESELAVCRQFGSSERRRSFLAGRMLAKQLLCEHANAALGVPPQQITLSCQSKVCKSDRPVAHLKGQRLDYLLSISHTNASTLVAGTAHIDRRVGVDLVQSRELGSAFEQSWFTSGERSLLEQHKELTAAELWALKEATYKACQQGESFSPRRIELSFVAGSWRVCYLGRDLQDRVALHTWRIRDAIAALVCTAPRQQESA